MIVKTIINYLLFGWFFFQYYKILFFFEFYFTLTNSARHFVSWITCTRVTSSSVTTYRMSRTDVTLAFIYIYININVFILRIMSMVYNISLHTVTMCIFIVYILIFRIYWLRIGLDYILCIINKQFCKLYNFQTFIEIKICVTNNK